MALSGKVTNNIQFLYQLNPEESSIDRVGNKLQSVKKRSGFRKVVSWFFHLITCCCFPRNSNLDRITRDILNDVNAELPKVLSIDDRKWVKKAIKNLIAVIKENGGSEVRFATDVLKTVKNIKTLPSVQNLEIPKGDSQKVGSDPVKQPEIQAIAPGTKFQDVLQHLFEKKASAPEIAKAIAPHLLTMKKPFELSDAQLRVLKRGISALDDKWMVENGKDLSLDMIAYIVEHSIRKHDLKMSALLHALTTEPINLEKLTIFIQTFQVGREINPDEHTVDFVPCLNRLTAPTIHCLEKYFAKDILKNFIQSLLSLVSLEIKNKMHEIVFDAAIELIDKFGQEYRQPILQALCRIKDVYFLARILRESKEEDHIIETILDLNPWQQDNPQDVFFENFLQELQKETFYDKDVDLNKYIKAHEKNRAFEKQLPKFVDYILKNASNNRKQILASKLPAELFFHFLEKIPPEILDNLELDQRIQLADKALKIKSLLHNDKSLETIVKTFKPNDVDHLFDKPLCAELLPYFDFDVQVRCISKLLEHKSWDRAFLISKAQQLDLDVWEEASRLNPKMDFTVDFLALDPKILAGVLNGQIHNKKFLKEFLKYTSDGIMFAEYERDLIQCLKPKVFEIDSPYTIDYKRWIQIFKIFDTLPDKEHAKKLSASCALNLFNNPPMHSSPIEMTEIFYALTKEQMKLLPIKEFKEPEIRLLLACLTGQLNDELIDTSNSLDMAKSEDFLYFFMFAYDEVWETSRNFGLKYLKDFISWVVHRDSIAPLLPTWTWINDYTDILHNKEIQEDARIQADIKKLGLVITPLNEIDR